MRAALLAIDGLRAGYGRSVVLHGVSLHVGEREIVCLLGANGAGKSTLLAAISGLLPISAGTIKFDGKPIAGATSNAIVRLGIAQVPERRQLFSTMTVEENLLLGAYVVSSPKDVGESLERCYALFPRLAERRTQVARSMSGGEQQMLAISRALMARPRLLLMDEPSLGLAPMYVKLIFEIIRKINHENGTPIFLVEQNAHMALRVAHRGYVMENGRITLEGTADSLLHNEDVKRAYIGA